jgi:hypothetical protein
MVSRTKKHIIIILAVINMLFSTGMSFAYWASSISGNQNVGDGALTIGDWYDNIPVFTTDEFIQVITTPNNTNSYILVNNLDFQNVTPSSWTQTKTVVFQGSFNGNGKTISNVSLSNYTGIFGIIQGATITNLTLNNITINYTVADTAHVGLLAGRMQGTNNSIENIRVINSSITSTTVVAGGLIGFASPVSGTGTASLSNIKVQNTTITGAFANNTYGTGGVVGTVDQFNMTMSDIYVEATVNSNAISSVGGIIGATLTGSTVSISRAVIFSNTQFRADASDTSVFAAGTVGRNQGAVSLTDLMFTGLLHGFVNNPNNQNTYTTRTAVTVGSGNVPSSQTNVRSAQITLFRRTQNPSILVDSQTLYDKMLGQKPAYSTTVYIVSRSTTMNNTWWTNNYSNITGSSLWTYNATTNLYELIN